MVLAVSLSLTLFLSPTLSLSHSTHSAFYSLALSPNNFERLWPNHWRKALLAVSLGSCHVFFFFPLAGHILKASARTDPLVFSIFSCRARRKMTWEDLSSILGPRPKKAFPSLARPRAAKGSPVILHSCPAKELRQMQESRQALKEKNDCTGGTGVSTQTLFLKTTYDFELSTWTCLRVFLYMWCSCALKLSTLVLTTCMNEDLVLCYPSVACNTTDIEIHTAYNQHWQKIKWMSFQLGWKCP